MKSLCVTFIKNQKKNTWNGDIIKYIEVGIELKFLRPDPNG